MIKPIVARTALLASVVVAVLCIAMFAGCHRVPAATDAQEDSAKEAGPKRTGEGVSLTAEQVARMGIATQPVSSMDYRDEIAGFGVIIPHDAIATAVAELSSAQAAQEQSRAAAGRAQRLAGTPGAMSADAVESAARQMATDTAAVALARRRLSSVIGSGMPEGLAAGGQLQELASGELKLLRATFPLGALQGATPPSLRVAHLDGSAPGTPTGAPGWTVHPLWSAPADATLPGRSFFAVLKGGDASEGERLLVWAPGTGPAQRGVLVPAAALVISDGKYWCYVEQKPHVYVRREIATDRPIDAGYFITQPLAAGDTVVTAAAGLLLAREMNPSTEAD
ncbi:MAG TPA: hypothetical protein VIY90_19460 [Steroidobacteraceae bacterium]